MMMKNVQINIWILKIFARTKRTNFQKKKRTKRTGTLIITQLALFSFLYKLFASYKFITRP